MKQQKVLLVGCGDIGIPLGLKLVEQGHLVWGVRRTIDSLPAEIQGMTADVTEAQSLSPLTQEDFDQVVITLTPSQRSDEGYRSVYVEGVRNILQHLKGAPFIIYVSSTGVYHHSNGEWVDEACSAKPDSFSGKRLLEAEQLLKADSFPFSVVRFSGIYGPGRNRLIEQVRSLKGVAKEPPVYTNRIHRDDCVGFILHLLNLQMEGKALEELYLATDCEPTSMWEVKRFIAEQLSIAPNQLKPESIHQRKSKRLHNKKMRATGYDLKYKNYKKGYGELIEKWLSNPS